MENQRMSRPDHKGDRRPGRLPAFGIATQIKSQGYESWDDERSYHAEKGERATQNYERRRSAYHPPM